jgi:predicted SnoaL-like aldol condensation-catalyzing enzyme
MIQISLGLSFLALAASFSSAYPTTSQYCPPQPVSSIERGVIFDAYVRTLYFNNITLAHNTFIAEDLIQHNPDIPNGRQKQLEAVLPIYAKSNFQLQNILVDVDYDMIFNRLTEKYGSGASYIDVLDIYRFDGSCLVEHWGVIQEVDANLTSSRGK